MCGICGVLDLRRERLPVTGVVLDFMTDSMTHRGPSDRGTLLEPGVALGARRLSIIDVAGGHQPFASEDQTVWAIQNGELYNHDEIRADLRDDGHVFTSRCDTEILPHLYERYGERVPERVQGKFAFAIWDRRRRRALIARDRLGVKPLYYAVQDDFLVFGSELKAVLASGLVDTDLDYDAIDAFLTLGYTPGPATPLRAVRKLLPGHLLVVGEGSYSVEPYWRYPEPTVASPRLSEHEYADGLMERLDLAVRRRLMSDVPVGAMLSGGLDSSLVVSLMAEHSSTPVETFAIGFIEAGRDMELDDARSVARLFGTNHHEVELTFEEAAVELPELLWHLDEPMFDISAIGLFALSKLAAEHVTGALSGQGADELLGGYKKHRAAAIVDRWLQLPRPARLAALGAARPFRNGTRGFETLAAEDDVERLLAMSGRVDDELRSQLFRGPLAATGGTAAAEAVRERLPGIAAGSLATTLHVDGTMALVDVMLQYFDRVSMAHSLEVRVPFLDHELVEFCATIPPDLKVRRLTTKYLLKRAARDLLPDEIVNKRKLGFFRPAAAGWLTSQLEGDGGRYLTATDARYAEFLDRKAVVQLVQAYHAGDRRHLFLLTSLMMLEVWLQTYVTRATETPSTPVALAQ